MSKKLNRLLAALASLVTFKTRIPNVCVGVTRFRDDLFQASLKERL